MISSIVIIGAGQAGLQAADTLRREGFTGKVTLIGDEAELPYQRPPLSKKYLSGELTVDRLLFRPQSFYDQHRIELRLGVPAETLEPGKRQVVLADASVLSYDRLLLCLGSMSRPLVCPNSTLPGVHYLRTLADVAKIRAHLNPGAHTVIIGGGYIGLETAATARKLGCEVTVLEMADRLMNRVAAPSVSSYFAAEHSAHGVKVICDARVVRLEGLTQVERVVTAGPGEVGAGAAYPADLLVVGVGAIPASRLASEAGIACDNGIVVDEYCRTSDPNIFAAGDCTNHPSAHYGRRMRLESVDNAVEQAKAAALNMLDRPTTHDRIPWFWSDQYDNKLLIVGMSQGCDTDFDRGDPATRAFSHCYLKDGTLIALEAVNQPRDYMAARKLIAERVRLDPNKLRDPTIALKDAI